MNAVMECILKRRSIRSFKAQMPKKEDIDQIIEAGLYAPSGHGAQSTIILAVTNKELRDRISKDNYRVVGREVNTDPFFGAPVILIVLADRSSSNRAYDGSVVMENMMLAATSLGLGSIWINRAREEFETEEYRQLLKDLGIEGEWEGVGHCAVGYIEGEVPQAAPRKPGRVYYVE